MNDEILRAVREPIGYTADPFVEGGLVREAYLQWIAPGETPERQAEMAQMSGCALVVAGTWRRLGIRHPLLDAPYETGTAVSRIWTIAREADACRVHMNPIGVRIGDVVLVSEPEHVWTVLEVLPCDGAPRWRIIWGVDGGQVRDGHQCVRKVKRWIRDRTEVLWTRTDRTVLDWIDVRAVLERFGSEAVR